MLRRVTHRAVEYLHKVQTPEGVWYGSWGICHTYATQFALESLSLVGETYATSERVRRACDFLVSKQMEDGGWGESWEVSHCFIVCNWQLWLIKRKTVLRAKEMDQPQKESSCPDFLGRHVSYVREIPSPRTY